MITIEPGDIIFYAVTPRSALRARLIAVLQFLRGEGSTATSYSHMSLAEDGQSQVEAWWPRSRRSSIDMAHPGLEVWRVKGVTPEQARGALAWARANLGLGYGLWKLCFGLFGRVHSYICTTFVTEAWKTQGIDLSAGAGRFVAPNELIDSGLLGRVG